MENESAYGDGVEMDSYYYLKENTSNMSIHLLFIMHMEWEYGIPGNS